MSHRPSAKRRRSKFEALHPVPPFAPTGPTADVYRIAGYTAGLIGAARPHFDSGLRWPDPNNPQPDDPPWGAGVGRRESDRP